MTDDHELCIRCGKPEADWNYWPHCQDCWSVVCWECDQARAEMEAEAKQGSERQ